MKQILCVPACMLVLFSGAVTAAADRIETQVERLAKPYVESRRVQSMAVGVIHGDKRYTFAFGQLSQTDDTKPDERTLYEIGSVTKTMTALLLADEVVRERVKLDTPLAELLPKDVTVPAGRTRPITLADLATHHSGLVRMPSNMPRGNKLDPYADYTLALMYEFIGGTKLLTEPGANYLYSNLASALLGQALAQRIGGDYDRIVAERIFKPLGMTDTTFALSDEQKTRFAPPFSADGDETHAWNLAVFNPAGGVRSNVADMMRYVEAQLGKRKTKLDGAITLSHMRQHAIRDGRQAMALGWHVAADRETYWHNGQTGGYHSYVGFNKKIDAGVIILANTSTYEIDRLGEQLIRMIAGRNEKPASFKKVVKVDRKVLERYVGHYMLAPTAIFTITRRGDQLYAKLTGQDAAAIYPESETRFNYRVVPATIVFEKNEKGEVYRLVLHQNGREMPAMRMKEAEEKNE